MHYLVPLKVVFNFLSLMPGKVCIPDSSAQQSNANLLRESEKEKEKDTLLLISDDIASSI